MNKIIKKNFFNKKILITGHTGFKGTWFTLWLLKYKPKILGISLPGSKQNSFYKKLNLEKKINTNYFDIGKNLNKTKKIISKFKPDFIFNFAAQALVSVSYEKPDYTLKNNLNININLLETLRILKKNCSVILITSDKVYENIEKKRPYIENDKLGGKDIYSVSKSASELIINGYKESFLKKKKNIRCAVVRAGNVIGGGDWSQNRLVPDIYRQWMKKKKLFLRNPSSTRPWQHVLEPLFGYMILAIKLKTNSKLNYETFNFSSKATHNLSVLEMVKKLAKYRNGNFCKYDYLKNKLFNEAKILNLSSRKAKKYLNWEAKLSFEEIAKLISKWYENKNKRELTKISKDQIEYYLKKINYE
jgi:CDP-glucose 4,6-dehydratase